MKSIAKALYGLAITLLVGIAGLFVASMIPIPGNIEIKIVKSGSMEPAIPTGSLVVIKPTNTYKLGDVVTFGEDTRARIPTTHRIVAIDASGLITTKGDANEEPDTQPVRKSDIIGTVVAHVPYAGFVLDFAKQPVGFVLLIAIPAAAIIVDELINIFREVYAAWHRRNRDRHDGSSGGTGSFDDSSTHVVFARRFSMDDVFVPIRIVSAHATRQLVSERQYVNAAVSACAVVATIALSTGGAGSTLSYFRDTENSSLNTFGAGEWADLTPPLLVDNTERFFAITTLTDTPPDEPPTPSEAPPEPPADEPLPPSDIVDTPPAPPSEPPVDKPVDEPTPPPEGQSSTPPTPPEETPPPPVEPPPPPIEQSAPPTPPEEPPTH